VAKWGDRKKALKGNLMAENLKYLTDDNFEQEIAQGVTLVDFYADWCGPCRMIAPIIEDLAKEYGDRAKIAKVDIESSQGITAQLNITSIPTLIVFQNGQEVNRVVGVRDKESLKELLDSHL
jgi:thioredoxin 1